MITWLDWLVDSQQQVAIVQRTGWLLVHSLWQYTRIDRVEENTHTRGATAQSFVDRWQPQWGPEQLGLQYGIALTVPGEQKQFHGGERVLMATFVRNVSDKPQQIDLRPDMLGNVPRVVDTQGNVMAIAHRDLLGSISHYRDTLRPGESFGPLYLNIGLGENPRPEQQSWTPYWRSPAHGAYRLTHHVVIAVAAPGVKGPAAEPPWQAGDFMSGVLEFEVITRDERTVRVD